MKNSPTLVQQVNSLLQSVNALSAELQTVLCLVLWAFIGFFLQVSHLQGEILASSMAWLVLLLIANGLVSGPLVAVLAACLCVLFMSPLGPLNNVHYSWGELAFNALALLCGAGVGGGFKRLLADVNQRLYIAVHQVEGTQLPNYKGALEYLEKLLKTNLNDSNELDVLRVQLQNLEEVHKLAGRAQADELVKEFASILKEKLGSDAYVSQPSANELLGFLIAKDDKQLDVNELLKSVNEETSSRNPDSTVSIVSSGSAQRHALRSDGANAQQLLDEAIGRAVQSYLEQTQRKEGDAQHTASPSNDKRMLFGKSAASRSLQNGIEKGEVTVEYLPRLSVYSGYFSALEASLVWHHPKRGLLDLNGILGLLDESMSLKPLHAWMVEQVLNDVEQWFEQGVGFVLSIRLSLDEEIPKSVVDRFLAKMKEHPEHTGWLALELNERALSKASAEVIESLRYIQQYGGVVIVSAYEGSTLALSKVFVLPVDAVKLSPIVIADAMSNSDKRREIASLIKLIHSRGLTVIAEGIESSAAIRMLRPYGCDELQGAFLSRSLAKDKIPWGRIRI